MKMNKMVFLSLLTLFAIGCNQPTNHQKDDLHIELNNGQKWSVNAEMKPFILDAEKILQQSNKSDYQNLAKQLDEKNKSLINSCTMKGKSHDELHKWLHPHMQLIKDLEEANEEEAAAMIIEELAYSFQTYHKYFE